MSRVEKEIPVSLIEMDRIPLDSKTFEFAYALSGLSSGGLLKADFPAIKVAKRPDGRYEIRDGRHRWTAHKLVGRKTIKAKFSETPLRRVGYAS